MFLKSKIIALFCMLGYVIANPIEFSDVEESNALSSEKSNSEIENDKAVQLLKKIVRNALIETQGNLNLDAFHNKNIFNCALTQVSGVQRVQLSKESKSFDVLCDQETYDGGWTVILNRFDGSINFHDRTLREYKIGFGNYEGEFFIGLDKLYALTNSRKHELLFLMEDMKNRKYFGIYKYFRIQSERKDFRLKNLQHYSGYGVTRMNDANRFCQNEDYNDVGQICQEPGWGNRGIFAKYQTDNITKTNGFGLCWHVSDDESAENCITQRKLKMLIRPINAYID